MWNLRPLAVGTLRETRRRMLHTPRTSPSSRPRLPSLFAAVTLAASVVVACSGSSTGTSTSADGTTPDNGDTSSAGDGSGGGACGTPSTAPPEKRQPVYHCCLSINDGPEKTYDCPSEDAVKKCAPGAPTSFDRPPPMPDTSQCKLVQEDPSSWCTPPPSTAKCRFVNKSCNEAGDCTDAKGFLMLGVWCNKAEHKCFDYMSTCVGERCADEQDCGFMEQCDPCSHKCVKAK